MSYHNILITALTYPLGEIQVGTDDFVKIMGSALKAMLPKLGLSSTLARELVHGPARYGAPEILHIGTIA